ncbi:MAG: hypothetical protein ACI8UZ_000695, partial [Akkermansiaceae bacterium]
VVFLEAGDDFIATVDKFAAEGPDHEGLDPVANVTRNRFFGMGWQVEVLQGVVEGRCDPGEGIDEGAI